MIRVKYPVSITCAFVWVGFVCAISFMEAWLKFNAPGISVPLGLGIGRLVFAALNKVELVLVGTIMVEYLITSGRLKSKMHLFYAAAIIILLVQTFYMLPALDARAQMHINGYKGPPSTLHFYYIAAEGLKVIFLCIFGILLFKKSNHD